VSTPLLSVIVPAHQGESVLPKTLGALAASDLPRDRWELIVVDDASSDKTSGVAAKWADRVIAAPGKPHGPGYARNRGVEASSGEWVVFIDADVVVHRDTLSRLAAIIAQRPDVDAIFGAYDDSPPAPGFLSQYRNLLHRRVHLQGAGEADTFWAGCGAVRRSAFMAIGGFDELRYPRPQIEDIELGYRLIDRGSHIVLEPQIQGAHLKKWVFWGSTRTDLFDRGIPWVRLLLERGNLGRRANLNLKGGERVKIALVWLALPLLVAAIVWRRPEAAIGAAFALLGVLLWNLPLLGWFARGRGPLFALAVVPMNLWYYLVSGLAVMLGTVQHVVHGSQARGGGAVTGMALDAGGRASHQ
jgi:glycosyltransferase involved in cell wall biosynthesis